jgi:hypothetical protein
MDKATHPLTYNWRTNGKVVILRHSTDFKRKDKHTLTYSCGRLTERQTPLACSMQKTSEQVENLYHTEVVEKWTGRLPLKYSSGRQMDMETSSDIQLKRAMD